ncbi:MAG: cadherin-like beta sandwich domain-containing protein [Coprobacillus sp.]
MKKIKSFIVMIMISLLCCQISKVDVFAAGMSASANTSSITIGSSFKVTVSASDCAAFDISASTSNGSISGGSSSLDTEGGSGSKSTTFTVKPSSVGTCTVTVKAVYAAYSGNSVDTSFSKTINVAVNAASTAAPSTPNTTPKPTPSVDNRSKENALASLSVSSGTLSPAFDAGTTKYSVSVDSNQTSIKIDAKAKDSKATVSGTGEKKLQVGDNEFAIKCIAENESSKTYTIIVHVDETPTVFTEFQNQKLGVVKNLKDIKVPTSFDENTTKINDQEVISWFSPDLNLTICYLSDESGKKDFYIVEDGKVKGLYQVVNLGGKNYVVLVVEDDQQKRDGFIYQEVTIQDYKFNGWVYKDEAFKDYVQVYLMNEQGKKHIYDYEMTEGQLQIYTEQAVAKSGINIFMITTGVFVLTSAGLLYLYLNFKKKSISAIKDYYQNKDQ